MHGVSLTRCIEHTTCLLAHPEEDKLPKQQQTLRWCRVMVQGPGPSARYAHTLALVANRFLVAMGGNDGKQTLSDAWALDTSDKPYQWRKITDAGETPSPRSVRLHTSYTCLDLPPLKVKPCMS